MVFLYYFLLFVALYIACGLTFHIAFILFTKRAIAHAQNARFKRLVIETHSNKEHAYKVLVNNVIRWPFVLLAMLTIWFGVLIKPNRHKELLEEELDKLEDFIRKHK